MRVSVLDLGSNSFHVLVADAEPDGTLVPVLREREMLHLGSALARHGEVPDRDRDAAVEVVTHLTDLAHRAGSERQLAVATSALRDASNGPQVVAELEAASDTPVRVLDGDDEARLAYLGVRASVAIASDPTLVLDLGGGSLELAVGTGSDVSWAASTDLGVSRLSEAVREGPLEDREVADLERRVDDQLLPLVPPVAAASPRTTVAVGGTVRALARVLAAREGRWVPATLNQLVIEHEQLEELTAALQGMGTADRAAMPGMKRRRADRAHVAATILLRTTELLGIERLTVSDWGLREGTILHEVGFRGAPRATAVRRGAIELVRSRFSPDPEHASHVAQLALRLFDRTRDVHGLADGDRALLRDAALLHDVGESLALRRQHHHGAYIVEHAEMRGLSPVETATIATLVRCHRSRGVSGSFPAYAAMTVSEQRRTERLLALLQVADGLDRTRDQSVRDLQFQRRDGRLQVVLQGDDLRPARTELARRAALFARTFDVELEIVDRLGTGD